MTHAPHERTVGLACGTLRLRVEEADLPLDQLCGFACRRSRRRGFVFLSKVLGKHYPVRPRVMEDAHARLATKLGDLPGPVLFLALAETATALGQGVYERWLRLTGRGDALFLHTTRYRLRARLALTFQECHSHATEHLVYEPADPGHAALFAQAASLVLLDDELSTGNTLANLAAAYRRSNARLSLVRVACLTDWLPDDRRGAFEARVGVPVAFHSLLRGAFTLDESPAFDPGSVPDVTGRGDCKDALLPPGHARLGVRGLLRVDAAALLHDERPRPGERVLVLGTGEFAYPPYLLARELERAGCDVRYQSTTRSPLLPGADVASVLEFEDNYHDSIPNYVYNVADRDYDRVLICYETSPLPAGHRPAETFGWQAVHFPRTPP